MQRKELMQQWAWGKFKRTVADWERQQMEIRMVTEAAMDVEQGCRHRG